MRLSDLPLDFSGILSNAMWVGQGKIYFDYKEEVKQNTGGYAYECLCPNLSYSTTIYLWVIPLLPVRIYPSHYLNC